MERALRAEGAEGGVGGVGGNDGKAWVLKHDARNNATGVHILRSVDDVRTIPLTDATLLEEWGPRYHVFMRKRAAERKWPSWQDDMVTGGF